LGGFAIGARVALLWQHNANPSRRIRRRPYSCSPIVTPDLSLDKHVTVVSTK